MISFFRKIRHQLLKQKNTAKYLKYAIGEIVLVMIGIVLALQINNWNENRKTRELTKGIYLIIKSDLESDITKINQFLTVYDSIRKPLFLKFLNEELTGEEIIKNPNLLNGFRGFQDIQINTRGYELLKNLPSAAIANQQLATQITSFYNTHLYEIEIALEELSTEFTDNNFHFKRNGFTWKYVIGKDDDKFKMYYLTDDDAKNRMAACYLFFRIYAEELRNFKTEAQKIIKVIEND